tara:strand:+ start:51045 stop:52364 length:1320 start_codon:yes stop_codon:yes gene_type:complete
MEWKEHLITIIISTMGKYKIGVIGLGYVGLPLARLLSTKYKVVGYDKSRKRSQELNSGWDLTDEIKREVLIESLSKNLTVICDDELSKLIDCNIYIITVPTPVDKNNTPDLSHLIEASHLVSEILDVGDIVIYESTVYPGATEEICLPILKENTFLKYNEEFFIGYSPERINPGDKKHTVDKIVKVTSGSTKESALIIDEIYNSVISVGTFMASSIKVAESSKVIENTQRDVNISLMNELSKIFNRLDIDTRDVLEASNTKWNFLPFEPGLVGGHCIGVDPYYLAQKAKDVGYHPEIILAGRRMNDGMAEYISTEIIKLMVNKNVQINDSNILILGLTFKENCPDIRNTKVVDLVKALEQYNVNITIYDPYVDPQEAKKFFGLNCLNLPPNNLSDELFSCIVGAVKHDAFRGLDIDSMLKSNGVIYDIKGSLVHYDKRL